MKKKLMKMTKIFLVLTLIFSQLSSITKVLADEITNDDILVKCAKIAAKHSKAKLSSNVPVDYCEVKYVKKPSGARPGMVIYTNNKTLNVNP